MPNRPTPRLIAILAAVVFVTLFTLSIRELPGATTMADTGVIHIVQFQFKADTTESDKKQVRWVLPPCRFVSR